MMFLLPFVLIVVAPSVLELIEAARAKAAMSHKELALNRNLSAVRWSQKIHGTRNSRVHVEDILNQPPSFVLAFAHEIIARFGGHVPATREDIESALRAVLGEREAQKCA